MSTADEGDTITYTLTYTLNEGEVAPMTIDDVLPVGLTYVPGSATRNDEILPSTNAYDPATRTLSWRSFFDGGGAIALPITKDGSVTYKVTVDQGATSLQQPLTNTVTIDSEQTDPVTADHMLFVGPLPEGVVAVAGPTAPATDAVAVGEGGGSAPEVGLWLVVLGLGWLVGGSVLVGRVPGARGVGRR